MKTKITVTDPLTGKTLTIADKQYKKIVGSEKDPTKIFKKITAYREKDTVRHRKPPKSDQPSKPPAPKAPPSPKVHTYKDLEGKEHTTKRGTRNPEKAGADSSMQKIKNRGKKNPKAKKLYDKLKKSRAKKSFEDFKRDVEKALKDTKPLTKKERQNKYTNDRSREIGDRHAEKRNAIKEFNRKYGTNIPITKEFDYNHNGLTDDSIYNLYDDDDGTNPNFTRDLERLIETYVEPFYL